MFGLERTLKTLPYHVHHIGLTSLTYSTIFWVLSPVASAKLFSVYRKSPRRTQINWNVRVVSLIQSIFICGSAICVILSDKSRVQSDVRSRLLGYSPMAARVQASAAGYFLWDILVSVLYLPILGPSSFIHGVCALSITMLGFYPFANYYGINFVLYELSTPFLNIHWFMDKSGLTGSTWQLINGICLMGTFFASRIGWGLYQSFNLYRDIWTLWRIDPASKTGLEAIGTTHDASSVSKWLSLTFLAANTILSGLNIYWFGRMVKSMRGHFQNDNDHKEK
ncbi:hypothetical protein H2200_005110 [Cladophialophora chaetospira]|uniref:TLC domain-containing protein n=1 Tax=Cladophialophora chaetospira TaxID=386627 RepID=A0AA39CJK6_9EURO|nr:hypothetical protein H2200_005110 [Cladophialophora chaetospira]